MEATVNSIRRDREEGDGELVVEVDHIFLAGLAYDPWPDGLAHLSKSPEAGTFSLQGTNRGQPLATGPKTWNWADLGSPWLHMGQ